MERDKNKPGNYLSMDGGSNWLSTLPALLTLEEIMRQLQRELNLLEAPLPCKIFDLIIASGHAALVALLIGKMHLTPSQATEAYKKLEPALSVGPTEDKGERERNMEAFRKAFTEVLEGHEYNENSLMLSEDRNASGNLIWVTSGIRLVRALVRGYTPMTLAKSTRRALLLANERSCLYRSARESLLLTHEYSYSCMRTRGRI